MIRHAELDKREYPTTHQAASSPQQEACVPGNPRVRPRYDGSMESSFPPPRPSIAMTLTGRRILITGGSRRIGRSIALAFARSGAVVTITTQRALADARPTLLELEEAGATAFSVSCRLQEETSVREGVEEAVSYMGGLDVLVNNAGSFETAALEEVSGNQWDQMFAINTRAPLFVAQAALEQLRKSPHTGRVLNLGSLGGLHPWATHAHYCASKAALHMLTQTMAKAWAPEVAVNCIAPGMIVTSAEPDAAYAHFAEKTPMRRNGRPEEVAELALFLACCSPFLTGQIIALDGGLGL